MARNFGTVLQTGAPVRSEHASPARQFHERHVLLNSAAGGAARGAAVGLLERRLVSVHVVLVGSLGSKNVERSAPSLRAGRHPGRVNRCALLPRIDEIFTRAANADLETK